MAFKKHQPRRTRGPIRRDYCPYCDGLWPLDEMASPFLAHLDGNGFPFSVRTYVGTGMLVTEFKCPDRLYMGFAPPKLPSFDDFRSEPWLMDVQTKAYEPQKWSHATQAKYCPRCGRDLKGKRPRVWR